MNERPGHLRRDGVEEEPPVDLEYCLAGCVWLQQQGRLEAEMHPAVILDCWRCHYERSIRDKQILEAELKAQRRASLKVGQQIIAAVEKISEGRSHDAAEDLIALGRAIVAAHSYTRDDK